MDADIVIYALVLMLGAGSVGYSIGRAVGRMQTRWVLDTLGKVLTEIHNDQNRSQQELTK